MRLLTTLFTQKGGTVLTSTLTKTMKQRIFFTKNEVFLAIDEFINKQQNGKFIVLQDDDIQKLLADKAKSIDSTLDWSTEKLCPNDIIRHFWKKYRVQYFPAAGEHEYYTFRKRRFLFI